MSQKTASVPEGYIVDYIDGKFRKDTPEEYVRQMVEKRVVNEHDYSRDQIKVEETIKIGDSKKRVDIAIYPENSGHAQKDIQIIIECKNCNNYSSFTKINIPYSCKLLFQELQCMSIIPRFKV